MTEAHGAHALLETVAALVLSLGGAAFVVRAWSDRRRARIRPAVHTASVDEGRVNVTATAVVVSLLSGSAAAIHLGAGPEHVEVLGDIGLGFYWAALIQGAFAFAWLASARSRRLATFGIVANVVLVAVWAVSRTVGLPLVPGGAEPVGTADAIAILLEMGLVALLALRLAPQGRRRSTGDRPRAVGASALVAVGGVAVLATAIAMVDLSAGHHGGGQEVPGAAVSHR